MRVRHDRWPKAAAIYLCVWVTIIGITLLRWGF